MAISEGSAVPIVEILASPAGLETFRQLRSSLPAGLGTAFFLFEDPAMGRTGSLSDVLSAAAGIPAVTVYDGMPVRPDQVYVVPLGVTVEMSDGLLHVEPRDSEGRPARQLVRQPPAVQENLYLRLFETAKDGMVLVDVETQTVRDANPYFVELTQYGREDLVGRGLADVAAILQVPRIGDIFAATRVSGMVRRDDLHLRSRDGEQVSVEIVANRFTLQSRTMVQFNIRDITARTNAARTLRETEERFRLFVESVRDYALFQLDANGTILSWNTGAERLLGWTEAEAIGQHASLVFVPEDVAAGEDIREIEKARANGRAEDERWHIRKDGSRFYASGVLTQVYDEQGETRGFAKIMRDNTALREQEEQLRKSVEDKSMLVREIHHRVKNNLQVIVSLLSLQANQTTDPQVLDAFEETEGRVRAIAQIHETLYASDDLTEVEFGGYVTRLARELVALHTTVPDRVKLQLQVTDMVLHIEQAIPLGLIANELIVNSLKHALNGGPGTLRVMLEYVEDSIRPELGETLDDGWARLLISDSGPGIPAGLDLSATPSLGYRLVHMLVRQIGGEISTASGPGARIVVRFPLRYE